MRQNILTAMEVQGRVIQALFLREMKTRFGEKRLGFLWAFFEPIIHVLGFILIWKIFGRMGPQGIHPVLFLVTGIIPFIMFSNIITKVMTSVAGNKALLVFPQIKIIDFILSRLVVEYTTYFVVFLFFLCACDYLGIGFTVKDPLGVWINFTLMALLAGGIGYLLLPLLAMFEFMRQVASFMTRILYVTSGVFFSIDKLPPSFVQYIQWNPVLQIMHKLRVDFFPQLHDASSGMGDIYTFFVIAGFWLAGITLTKRLIIHVMTDK